MAVEEQLHFVPFHELMGLSLLLDRAPTVENLELVLQTTRSLVERSAQYKAFLEQAGTSQFNVFCWHRFQVPEVVRVL